MVTGSLKENLSAVIKIRDHEVLADVSENLGGHDTAPNPHELIEAGLAACTIITCQMYARRKQWNLVSTDVTVTIISETKDGAKIKRDIRFRGDLNEEQRQRLLEIANKCPIHNLLEGKIEIETQILT